VEDEGGKENRARGKSRAGVMEEIDTNWIFPFHQNKMRKRCIAPQANVL